MSGERVKEGLAAILPHVSLTMAQSGQSGPFDDFMARVAGRRLRVRWVPRGTIGEVERAIGRRPKPEVIMAPRLSTGARESLDRARIGWIDESGAANVHAGTIIVVRESAPGPVRDGKAGKWTRATLGVAEALLTGATPTVDEVAHTTGISASTAALALKLLTEEDLLRADAARGRASGRHLRDPKSLLDAYAEQVARLDPGLEVRAGVLWRDEVAGMVDLGAKWDRAGISWAATGALSAAVLAPYGTQVSPLVVYVGASTAASLRSAVERAGLKTLQGGRLLVRPFPTPITARLASTIAPGLHSVPWPRVYADLLGDGGVRAEEIAEVLSERMLA
jgi:hypothetical protein